MGTGEHEKMGQGQGGVGPDHADIERSGEEHVERLEAVPVESADDERSTSRTYRLAVVDHHPGVRQGMVRYFGLEGFDVVGTAKDGMEAVKLAEDLRPDVITMCIDKRFVDGLEALALIRGRFPDVQVVVLTAYPDESFEQTLTAAGAAGCFVENRADPEGVVRAARLAAATAQRIRRAVASRLARIEGQMALLRDEDADVRRSAAETLGKLKNPRAVDRLMEALKDEDEGVRLAASEALGVIGDAHLLRSIESVGAVCYHRACGRPARFLLRWVLPDPLDFDGMKSACRDHVDWYKNQGWRVFHGPMFLRWERNLETTLRQVPRRLRDEMLRSSPFLSETFDERIGQWESEPETRALAGQLRALREREPRDLPMHTLDELLERDLG